jgi:hypothetical protein
MSTSNVPRGCEYLALPPVRHWAPRRLFAHSERSGWHLVCAAAPVFMHFQKCLGSSYDHDRRRDRLRGASVKILFPQILWQF